MTSNKTMKRYLVHCSIPEKEIHRQPIVVDALIEGHSCKGPGTLEVWHPKGGLNIDLVFSQSHYGQSATPITFSLNQQLVDCIRIEQSEQGSRLILRYWP